MLRVNHIADFVSSYFGIRTLESLQQNATGDVGRFVTTSSLDGQKIVIVPLGRRDADSRYAVALRSKGPHPPTKLIIFGIAVLVSITVMLISYFSLGGSRRESELDAQLARLRSLPVGVIETVSTHAIAVANDRAEEILQEQLPKAGAITSVRPRKESGQEEMQKKNQDYDTLFDDKEDFLEILPDETFRWRSSETIRRLRLAGLRSTYFGKLRRRRGWVKMVVSPLLEAGKEEESPKNWMPAFGVVLECTSDELKHIDQERSKRRESVDWEVEGQGDGI